MQDKAHWERVYTEKNAEAVSWYQEHAENSLALIHRTGIGSSAAIIDVGGGASTLVDDLLQENFCDITVLDLSAASLQVARSRLGARADAINWLEADITRAALPILGFSRHWKRRWSQPKRKRLIGKPRVESGVQHTAITAAEIHGGYQLLR